MAAGQGWKFIHQPTHLVHFYDVYRLEFHGAMSVETLGSPRALMVVEEDHVVLDTRSGMRERLSCAETRIVLAAA